MPALYSEQNFVPDSISTGPVFMRSQATDLDFDPELCEDLHEI